MFLITLRGKEEQGAYAAIDEFGNHILYIFEEEDDATRFALLLEEDDYPEMNVIGVEEKLVIKACELHGYEYRVFTPDDIVVPPSQQDNTDFI
jgi:hypothetical protein